MNGSTAKPEKTPESEVIHSVNTCPACEFSSMKIIQRKQVVGYKSFSGGAELIDVDLWECRGCGFQEHLMA